MKSLVERVASLHLCCICASFSPLPWSSHQCPFEVSPRLRSIPFSVELQGPEPLKEARERLHLHLVRMVERFPLPTKSLGCAGES
jgi:hypothetical protein